MKRPIYTVTVPALIGMSGIIILLGAWGYRLLAAFGLRMPLPYCLFNRLTGLPCPTCGITRAFFALSQGHLWTALSFQPLIIVLTLISMVLLIIDATLWVIRGKQILPRLLRYVPLSTRSILLLFLLNWIYLMIHLSPRVQQFLGLG